MKYDVAPPYAPNCDITLSMTDCAYEQMHLTIYGIGAIFHIIVAIIGCFVLFRTRKRNNGSSSNGKPQGSGGAMSGTGRRFTGQPMRSLSICMAIFVTTRLIHNTLCAFDIVNSLAVRTAGVVLSCWFGYWGLLVFTAGILETVQQTTGRISSQHSPSSHEFGFVRIPSRRFTATFLCAMWVIGSVVPAVLAFIGGQLGQEGDWDAHFRYVLLAWGIWGGIFFINGTFYAYYAFVLTMTLRRILPQNYTTSAKTASGDNRGAYGMSTRTPSPQMAFHGNDSGHHHSIDKKGQAVELRESYLPLTEAEDEDSASIQKPSFSPRAKFGALYAYAMKETPLSGFKSPSSVVTNFNDPNEEMNERAAAIKRLRSVLYHLVFFYFNTFVTSWLWAFGANWLNSHVGIGTVVEICFLAVLWPGLCLVIFYRYWQMERARLRTEERRSASGDASIPHSKPQDHSDGDHLTVDPYPDV